MHDKWSMRMCADRVVWSCGRVNKNTLRWTDHNTRVRSEDFEEKAHVSKIKDINRR